MYILNNKVSNYKTFNESSDYNLVKYLIIWISHFTFWRTQITLSLPQNEPTLSRMKTSETIYNEIGKYTDGSKSGAFNSTHTSVKTSASSAWTLVRRDVLATSMSVSLSISLLTFTCSKNWSAFSFAASNPSVIILGWRPYNEDNYKTTTNPGVLQLDAIMFTIKYIFKDLFWVIPIL